MIMLFLRSFDGAQDVDGRGLCGELRNGVGMKPEAVVLLGWWWLLLFASLLLAFECFALGSWHSGLGPS
jgi:hypothetical protein